MAINWTKITGPTALSDSASQLFTLRNRMRMSLDEASHALELSVSQYVDLETGSAHCNWAEAMTVLYASKKRLQSTSPPPALPLPLDLQHGLDRIQSQIQAWLLKQPFGPNQPNHHPLLGLTEELGELARSHLKAEQGIRGSKNEWEIKGQDAVGDIFIFLMGYCNGRGWSIKDCIAVALAEVLSRDWAANPENGKV